MEGWKSEFEPGWKVLVRIPGNNTMQVATILPHAGKRRVHGHTRSDQLSIWVDVDGKKFLIPELQIEAKKDEPYYRSVAAPFEKATLERCIVVPGKEPYVKHKDHWAKGSRKVRSRIMTRLLDETYEQLAAKAQAAGA